MENLFYNVYETELLGPIVIYEKGYDIVCLQLGNGHIKEGAIRNETEEIFDCLMQINQYCFGQRKSFELPLVANGSPFALKVYQYVLGIPYGKMVTYDEVAKAIGEEGKEKEVEEALLKNPLPIFIPCHRVVSKDGKGGSYIGGIELKKKILKMEITHAKTDFVAPSDYQDPEE